MATFIWTGFSYENGEIIQCEIEAATMEESQRIASLEKDMFAIAGFESQEKCDEIMLYVKHAIQQYKQNVAIFKEFPIKIFKTVEELEAYQRQKKITNR